MIRVEMKEFNDIEGMIDNIYHDIASSFGISDTEMNILYAMCEEGNGCNQSVLYKSRGTAKSTVNSCIKKMEREGLLRLEAGRGRNTRVFLTEKGEQKMKDTAGRVIEAENRIWNSLSEDERKEIIRLNAYFAKAIYAEAENMKN